jgi:uncharacterized membrane protein YhdT
MKKILEIDPSNDQAGKSIRRLEPLAAVKREKMKEEMIGKTFLLIVFQIYLYFLEGSVCGHGFIALPVFYIVKCVFCPTLFNVMSHNLKSFMCFHQTTQASDIVLDMVRQSL